MSLTPEEHKSIMTMLEVASDELEDLTDWEANFIESITDQYNDTEFLSKKQIEILKKIYDKVV